MAAASLSGFVMRLCAAARKSGVAPSHRGVPGVSTFAPWARRSLTIGAFSLIAAHASGVSPPSAFSLAPRVVVLPDPHRENTRTVRPFPPEHVRQLHLVLLRPHKRVIPVPGAFQNGGQAWDITLLPDYNHGDRAVTSIAKYGTEHVLASGWLSGERAVAGKNLLIEARLGQGRVVLFGFRPQFRGQSFGTFRLVLNALYLSAAKPAGCMRIGFVNSWSTTFVSPTCAREKPIGWNTRPKPSMQ